jgi:hypothetical protein
LAQVISLWRHDAGRRVRPAGLGDGAAWAASANRFAAGRSAEARGEIRRYYAGPPAGAEEAAAVRAAGSSRFGRAAARHAAAGRPGSSAAEAGVAGRTEKPANAMPPVAPLE